MLLDFKHTQQIFADLFFWYLVWGWSLHSDSLTYGRRKLVYITAWHLSKIWYILSQNKQKNFVAYIDTQTGPRSPGHSSCLKDLFVILVFYVQWHQDIKKHGSYLIFVIFLHGQNFWRIKFTPKNSNFSR